MQVTYQEKHHNVNRNRDTIARTRVVMTPERTTGCTGAYWSRTTAPSVTFSMMRHDLIATWIRLGWWQISLVQIDPNHGRLRFPFIFSQSAVQTCWVGHILYVLSERSFSRRTKARNGCVDQNHNEYRDACRKHAATQQQVEANEPWAKSDKPSKS